jgi:hypothetical protein
MSYLSEVISQLKDPRRESNAIKYSLHDAVLGAFSVFFMQCDSFLEHQRQMSSRCGQNNAETLFGLVQVPSAPQIRNILDEIAAVELFVVFKWVYQALQAQGYLEAYKCLGSDLLVTLDGTQYHSSDQIHCACCSSRTHKDGSVTYSHTAILPVIVAPGKSEVITLAPELIAPQDGAQKQDCEVNASKRWINTHAPDFIGQPITLLGDDLYSRQPMCETVLAAEMNFIFTCLEESHPELYDWLNYLDGIGEIQTLEVKKWNKRSNEIYRYRYVNQIPLRQAQPALEVNWCELTLIRESDGKVLYQNAFCTRHPLDKHSVVPIVEAGRCRWKTENENHNILKTKGYHLEHNFGHGKKHLSAVLVTLNLLSFLFHTVLQLVDDAYRQIRLHRGTRRGFFYDILALTKYLLFESWQALMDFMLPQSAAKHPVNSS